MKLLVHSVLTLLLAAAIPTVGVAQDVAGAVASVEAADAHYVELLSRFEQSREQFLGLAADIEAAKTVPPATPFDVLELQRALREAHGLALSLTTLEDELRSAAAARDAASTRLTNEASAELVALETQIAANPLLADMLRPRVDELTSLVERFEAPLPAFESVPIAAIAAGLPDSSEEWYAAADELEDAASRLQRQLDEVRERLDQAEARERLERRVSGIAFEEAMFETDRGRRFESPRDTVRETATSGEGGAPPDDSRDSVSEVDNNGAEGLETGDDGAAAGGPEFDGPDEGAIGAPEVEPDLEPDLAPDEGTPLGTPTTVTVRGGTSPDQTQLDQTGGPTTGSGARGRSTRDLRGRQATIEAELDAVRAEQQRIIDRARELESQGL